MSCNCKSDIKAGTVEPNKIDMGGYLLKILSFIMLIIALPVLNVVILWYSFKGLVLGESIDLKPIIAKLGNKMEYEEIMINKE